LGKFAGKFTFYTVATLGGLAILQGVGVEVTGFAAVLAAAGFAIGLAFQGTLSNFASGILLLVFRPFKVGDLVIAAGVMGKINEIDLFTTTFDTPDNRRLIVPNSSIAGTTIENISYHPHRRVDVTVGVAYASSLDETRAVLTACAEALADKMICGEGRGYQILLANLGPSSVDWTVRFWAASSDFFAVKERLTSEIKRQLDTRGIQIPFPQMQLHVSETAVSGLARTRHEQPSLPIPKLNSMLTEERAGRIRPRIRGESSSQ
jgi:small conductance mechanosensitive channel